MSDYEAGLTQSVQMNQLESVINSVNRGIHQHDDAVVQMDSIQSRGAIEELNHILRPRQPFAGEPASHSGTRTYSLNQVHGFQQLQPTQSLNQNPSPSRLSQSYSPRSEQPYATPSNFDVNAFLNTRQSQKAVPIQAPCYPSSSGYSMAGHLQQQDAQMSIPQQFIHQQFKSNVPSESPGDLSQHSRLPVNSSISAMLPGIKAEPQGNSFFFFVIQTPSQFDFLAVSEWVLQLIHQLGELCLK